MSMSNELFIKVIFRTRVGVELDGPLMTVLVTNLVEFKLFFKNIQCTEIHSINNFFIKFFRFHFNMFW